MEGGVYQLTTSVSGAGSGLCAADSDPNTAGGCPANCLSPDPNKQPIYYAKDYGYVGGFAQAASEESIMREILENGPVSIELSVKAIPMLFSGNSGKTIAWFDNSQPHFDDVPAHAADHRFAHLTAAHNASLATAKPYEFKDWLWVDHALLSVGWGEEAVEKEKDTIILGTPKQLSLFQQKPPTFLKYWVIRNSWGQDWAEGGYGRLVRGENAGGIEISAVWITPDMDRLPKQELIPFAPVA